MTDRPLSADRIRCEVPFCRGYTRLERRIFHGRYLCYRHAVPVPNEIWDAVNQVEYYDEQRALWLCCI